MLAFTGFLVIAAVAMAASTNISDFTTSPVDFIYPPNRGYSASTASVYACGGIDPTSSRTPYPLSGGEIALSSQTLAANVNLLYVNETDPQLFHDFSTFTDSVLVMSVGDYCVQAPDFAAKGLSAGDDVTLLVIWQFYGNSSNPYYYHCADVTLVDNSAYTTPSTFSCSNSSQLLDVAEPDESLVLNGDNFTNDAAGDNGQTVSLTSTPTVTASTSATVSTSRAASAVSAAASTTSSAASAGSITVARGGVGALVGALTLAFAWCTL